MSLLLRQRLPELRVLEAGSLHLALRLLERQRQPVDLVMLDLELRDSRGLATLDRLRGDWPRLPVLVVSGSLDESLAGEALRRGASCFLSKSVGSDRLIETLRRTLLVDAGEAPERAEPLSDRQQEVLGLLLEGKSNKLICRELDLSEATVKSHLQAIFRKLEVSSRTQAVLAAVRLGLSPDGSGGPR
ncbi:DNA-binding NarL/FixJ family response regulator [Leptothrix sp. C29]|uniref:DNA-binding NarL/FixJ family response regulator n=2 Tax=Sphaerotilus uruguayifluvii TaxID=2735897 RepID=A0ABX2G127_9BURK|nr:DNA-binding NarL/FixJ family response regulator [Leptothrix sp. C29]